MKSSSGRPWKMKAWSRPGSRSRTWWQRIFPSRFSRRKSRRVTFLFSAVSSSASSAPASRSARPWTCCRSRRKIKDLRRPSRMPTKAFARAKPYRAPWQRRRMFSRPCWTTWWRQEKLPEASMSHSTAWVRSLKKMRSCREWWRRPWSIRAWSELWQ